MTRDKYLRVVKHTCLSVLIWGAVGLLLLLPKGAANERKSSTERMDTTALLQQHIEARARDVGADYVIGNFRPSLEMREKVDFLLTPALLIQETLSENIVTTYPEE
jgi:hypothetical protein